MSFTGSVDGGRAIERAAAGTFTSVGLELGGKDPAYVRADANLDHAIENLVDGAFFNSGQSCCGVERIYVHAASSTASSKASSMLTAKVRARRSAGRGDDARADGRDPLRRRRAPADGRRARQGRQGAHRAARFPRSRDGTPWLAPQVLTDVDHSMAVMMEESFGPVVGIMKVAGDEEAVRLMNDSPYGLTASIWTRDQARRRAHRQRDRDRHRLHEPLRLPRSRPRLDRRQGHRRGASLSRIGYEMLTRPKSFHLRKV